MLQDSAELRDLLIAHYPGLEIMDIAKKSGQRVVYFTRFNDFFREEAGSLEPENYPWSQWGDVVLKVSDGSYPVGVARAQQETEVLLSLNSKYYPKLHYHELLTFDPRSEIKLAQKLYVTIETRIEGKPLSDCLDQYQREDQVRLLLLELINGLKELWHHKNQYIHRDLKPDNILIQPNSNVVIIDLGILRESGSDGVTATHFDIGPCTPAFASPEQAKNDKIGITYKSDMFSLGTLAYTLITGSNPFHTRDGISPREILENVISLELDPLQAGANVSETFSLVIAKMMEKEPYKRYRRADQLIKELKESEGIN